MCNDFLDGFGDGTLYHDDMQLNQLAGAIIELNSSLISFGFISNVKKLQDLMPTLIKVLDGRRDADELDRTTTDVTNVRARGAHSIEFEPASDRFRTTQKSPYLTKLKTAIIDIVFGIDDLRSNLRLAKFLQYFKTMNESKSDQKLLVQVGWLP